MKFWSTAIAKNANKMKSSWIVISVRWFFCGHSFWKPSYNLIATTKIRLADRFDYRFVHSIFSYKIKFKSIVGIDLTITLNGVRKVQKHFRSFLYAESFWPVTSSANLFCLDIKILMRIFSIWRMLKCFIRTILFRFLIVYFLFSPCYTYDSNTKKFIKTTNQFCTVRYLFWTFRSFIFC